MLPHCGKPISNDDEVDDVDHDVDIVVDDDDDDDDDDIDDDDYAIFEPHDEYMIAW